ncbi:MAG: molybdenum cofactor guanylyltransferase [Anaerolineae bacterium]|jgi:molybdopterin-guanine dinucleotide biosynthesis protein A
MMQRHPSRHKAVSVAILAGGKGRRLGRHKADVLLAGEPLLAHTLRRLDGLSDDVMVVARRGQRLPVEAGRLIYDSALNRGVLAGMAAALAAARHDLCLIVACDMPFLEQDLLQHMIDRRDDYDAVIPRLTVGLEPLHALYHRRCLPILERFLSQGERRVSAFCAALNALYLDETELVPFTADVFFNVNTPEDLARAEARLAGNRARS